MNILSLVKKLRQAYPEFKLSSGKKRSGVVVLGTKEVKWSVAAGKIGHPVFTVSKYSFVARSLTDIGDAWLAVKNNRLPDCATMYLALRKQLKIAGLDNLTDCLTISDGMLVEGVMYNGMYWWLKHDHQGCCYCSDMIADGVPVEDATTVIQLVQSDLEKWTSINAVTTGYWLSYSGDLYVLPATHRLANSVAQMQDEIPDALRAELREWTRSFEGVLFRRQVQVISQSDCLAFLVL